jgi:hypothetical protein
LAFIARSMSEFSSESFNVCHHVAMSMACVVDPGVFAAPVSDAATKLAGTFI